MCLIFMTELYHFKMYWLELSGIILQKTHVKSLLSFLKDSKLCKEKDVCLVHCCSPSAQGSGTFKYLLKKLMKWKKEDLKLSSR